MITQRSIFQIILCCLSLSSCSITSFFTETTQNAWIDGNWISITSTKSGTISAIPFATHNFVKKGDLLIELDPTEAAAALAHAQNNLERNSKQVCRWFKQVFQTRSEIAKRTSELDKLFQKLSHQPHLETAQLILKTHIYSLQILHRLHDKALSKIQGTSIKNHPLILAALNSEQEALNQYNACKIYSPTDASIHQPSAHIGMKVEPNTPLLKLVPSHQTWVNALFTKKQMKRLQVGQTVELISREKTTFKGTIAALHDIVRIELQPQENHPLPLGTPLYAKVNLLEHNLNLSVPPTPTAPPNDPPHIEALLHLDPTIAFYADNPLTLPKLELTLSPEIEEFLERKPAPPPERTKPPPQPETPAAQEPPPTPPSPPTLAHIEPTPVSPEPPLAHIEPTPVPSELPLARVEPTPVSPEPPLALEAPPPTPQEPTLAHIEPTPTSPEPPILTHIEPTPASPEPATLACEESPPCCEEPPPPCLLPPPPSCCILPPPPCCCPEFAPLCIDAPCFPCCEESWRPSRFWPKRITLRHVEGTDGQSGISYGTDYTTLALLYAPDYRPGHLMPLLDLRGHRFDNNTWACNVGIGGRYIPCPNFFCELWGLNVFYDYRQGFKGNYHQVGVGLEILGNRWDFRANGYIPLGRASNMTCCVANYLGGYFIEHSDCEYATYGFNAEIGCLPIRTCNFLVYLAAGPYYLTRKTFCFEPLRGIKARIRPQYKDYFAVDCSISYDHVYKTVYQTAFILYLPLYQLSCTRNQGPCCITDRQIYQPIERFEIMPLGRRNCWKMNF